jgi:hypothetical protein
MSVQGHTATFVLIYFCKTEGDSYDKSNRRS